MSLAFNQFECGPLLAEMTGSQIAVWVAIFMAVFIAINNGRRQKTSGSCGGGWKWAFLPLAMMVAIFVVVSFGIRKMTALKMEQARAVAESRADEVRAQIQAQHEKWLASQGKSAVMVAPGASMAIASPPEVSEVPNSATMQ